MSAQIPHHRRRRSAAGLVAAALLAAGCAHVDPRPDYREVAALTARSTGGAEVWTPEDDPSLEARAHAILASDALDMAGAVKVALIENRTLRARVLDAGIAKADFVQAGLWTNPSVSAGVRFSAAGAPNTVDATLLQSLADFWQVPVRRGAARRSLDHAIVLVARDLADAVRGVRASFIKSVEAGRKLDLARENQRLAAELAGLARERMKVGSGTALDDNLALAEVAEAEVAVTLAELALGDARAALTQAMGLGALREAIVLIPAASGGLAAEGPPDAIVEIALRSRLDVRAAGLAVDAAAAAVRLECARAWKTVNAGVDLENQGGLSAGPTVGLELPIFDQNQAQIARARLALARERARSEAARRTAEAEVRAAFKRLGRAEAACRLFERAVIANGVEALRLAKESFSVGKAPFLVVLDAERRLVTARRSAVEADAARALAEADLEAAAGLPLDEIQRTLPGTSTRPETRTATEDVR